MGLAAFWDFFTFLKGVKNDFLEIENIFENKKGANYE